MLYCLPCHAEYITKPTRCPTCGGRLMTENERILWLQEQEELTNETLRPVHLLEGLVDKAILGALLTDAEVPFIIRGDPTDSFHAAMVAQYGWGVILVPDEEFVRARDIIRTYLESVVPESEEPAPPETEPRR